MAVNHAFLKSLAEEDLQVNGWRSIATNWMLEYDGYFEEEDDGDDFEDDIDEGFGREEVASDGMIDAQSIYFRETMFCVTTAAVRISTNNVYYLCSRCYINYIEWHSGRYVEHEHVSHHMVLTTDNVLQLGRGCASCRLPLTQVIARDVCLICN